MLYINQIKELLNCSTEHANNVFDLMSHLDLSEMSQETFDFEVKLTNQIEAQEFTEGLFV